MTRAASTRANKALSSLIRCGYVCRGDTEDAIIQMLADLECLAEQQDLDWLACGGRAQSLAQAQMAVTSEEIMV